MPEHCLTLICFAPFSYNAACQNALFIFTPPLIFGLPSLGWLFHYAKPLLLIETIFDLGLFDLRSLFQEHN